jgi:hypothetical protein
MSAQSSSRSSERRQGEAQQQGGDIPAADRGGGISDGDHLLSARGVAAVARRGHRRGSLLFRHLASFPLNTRRAPTVEGLGRLAAA